MTELSPDTARIVEAFDDCYEMPHDDNWQELCIAAVLLAAADQVVPNGPKPSANSDYHLNNWTKSMDQYYQRQQTREELLAIAAELKAS